MSSAAPPFTSLLRLVIVGAMAALIVGCGTRQTPSGDGSYPVGGGDFRRDGPHANPPSNLNAIPNAVPRVEPLLSGPNKPYVINGKRYVPDTSGAPYRVRGHASWYGRQFHGRPTSSGERYDMYAMTAAHPTLPIPSYARVTRPDTGRSIIVRINDRGPFHSGRVIDLSYVAAYQLDTLKHGTAEVVVERIMPQEIKQGAPAYASAPPPTPVAATTTQAPTTSPASQLRATADSTFNTVASASNAALPSGIREAGLAVSTRTPMTNVTPEQATRPAPPDAIAEWAGKAPNRFIPIPQAPGGPASAPAPVAPAGGDSATGAFLQLGAFGEARNARNLAKRIQDQVQAYGSLEVVNQGGSYRVRLGPFANRNAAVAHIDAVYQQTGIMPHVVRH